MIKRIAADLLFAAILLLLLITVLHRDRYRSMIGGQTAASVVSTRPPSEPLPEAPAAERPAAEATDSLLRTDSLR